MIVCCGMEQAMPVVSPRTEGGDAGQEPDLPKGGRAARALLRGVGRSAIAICAVVAILLAAGFAWFLHSLPADEIVLARNADGIVVLTEPLICAPGSGQRLFGIGWYRDAESARHGSLPLD